VFLLPLSFFVCHLLKPKKKRRKEKQLDNALHHAPRKLPQTPTTSLTLRTRFLHELNELHKLSQTPPHPQLILRSVTSGTFRDYWKKNDDEKNRFMFLYLWAMLTFMSMIGGRNEVHYVSKLLLCAFDHENLL
jgi:hypothetical protein